MAGETSEALDVGAHLACARCGTQVRLERVGGGRMECCDEPLASAAAAAGARTARAERRARCAGCGNEVAVERDGGGQLECCSEEMAQL
jgi:desulfoferrodoxin-like iron-binding protein